MSLGTWLSAMRVQTDAQEKEGITDVCDLSVTPFFDLLQHEPCPTPQARGAKNKTHTL